MTARQRGRNPVAVGLRDLRTSRAIEQPDEGDSRSDGQELAQGADGAVDGDDKVKADREQRQTYQSASDKGDRHTGFLVRIFNWLLVGDRCIVK